MRRLILGGSQSRSKLAALCELLHLLPVGHRQASCEVVRLIADDIAVRKHWSGLHRGGADSALTARGESLAAIRQLIGGDVDVIGGLADEKELKLT